MTDVELVAWMKERKIKQQPMTEWKSIDSSPENEPIMTKIHDGDGIRNEAVLVRIGRLFFIADLSTYVYYTPTHWRATNAPGGNR